MAIITPQYKRYNHEWDIYEIENMKFRPQYIEPMVCIGKKI